MRAAVLREIGAELAIEDIGVDEPAEDEVLVRVVASGVCHSDRTAATGGQIPPMPTVLGHEVAGVVERVGSAVRYVAPGDRVAVTGTAFCGVCEWCVSGHPQHCLDKKRSRAHGRPPRLHRDGEQIHQYVGVGGFAEYTLVHERAVARIPDGVGFEVASLLGCAVVTGVGAVLNTAMVRPGEKVAVIGCGGVGLNAVQAAALSGAGMIIAVDLVADKLRLAEVFGATHGVDASTGDAVEQVREISLGGVDHVIEAVGAPATVEQGYAMLRIRGTLTMVGLARAGAVLSLPAAPMLLAEKRIQGSKMGGNRFRLDVARYSELYLAGRLKLDELIADTAPLDSVERALAALDTGGQARTVLTFPAS